MAGIDIEYLGKRDYRSTWDYQRDLFERKLRGELRDKLLLVEHNPVFTVGKSGDMSNIVVDDCILEQTGFQIISIDRGGDITYHGPGQLVGYPVIDLNNYYRDVHRYLRDLEEVVIRALADFGIAADREEGMTGVWVNGEKIAAIGVKVSRWITMHGFALNVNTNLDHFNYIVPCGISGRHMTSMKKILDRTVSLRDTAQRISFHFCSVFVEENSYARTIVE
ncbi:lipoyl(octanoyl) transferase LipB [candidate division KSB1 bacterium]